MLCEICHNIPVSFFELKDLPYSDERRYFSHHRTLQKLNASAEDGCHMCRLMSDALELRNIKYLPANREGVEGKSEIRLNHFSEDLIVEYGHYEAVPLHFEFDSYTCIFKVINTI